MPELDAIDLEILRLLAEDARRPYSEIAERVDRSPPAVSDRVTRLEEHGVIRRFTVDVDRTQLHEGTPVLCTLAVDPDAVDDVRDAIAELDGAVHTFVTADARVTVHANAPSDVRGWLFDAIDPDRVRDIDVRLLDDAEWTPQVGAGGFALTCAECGNDVGPGGVTERIGGDRKAFCCPSCRQLYEERYEELAEVADS